MANHKRFKSGAGSRPGAQTEDERLRLAFGALVKKRRLERKMSQRTLGDRIGIHPNHIGRYERGAVWPSISVLITLSKVLGVRMDRLVLGEAAEPKPAANGAPEASDPGRTRLAVLAEQAGALSASDQLVVIALIEAFLLKVKVVEMARG